MTGIPPASPACPVLVAPLPLSPIAAITLFVLALQASPVIAQTRFEQIPLRVDLGDDVRLEDQSGGRTAGRVAAFTPSEIVLMSGGVEHRFTSSNVRDVAVRGHRLLRPVLIGAAVFAVLGGVAMCTRDEPHCAIVGPVAAAPVGAGLGLVAGALFQRWTTVYRATGERDGVPSPAGSAGGFLADLALRANLDDDLQVEGHAGASVSGRLMQLTPDTFTVVTAGGERQFTRQDVRRVRVRRHPLRAAVLVGAGAGALAGAAAACLGSDRSECVDAPLMAGALGAGAGLAAGALIHRTTTVYPSPRGRAELCIAPAVAGAAVGVAVVRRW